MQMVTGTVMSMEAGTQEQGKIHHNNAVQGAIIGHPQKNQGMQTQATLLDWQCVSQPLTIEEYTMLSLPIVINTPPQEIARPFPLRSTGGLGGHHTHLLDQRTTEQRR